MNALEIIGAIALGVVVAFAALWASGLIEISVEKDE